MIAKKKTVIADVDFKDLCVDCRSKKVSKWSGYREGKRALMCSEGGALRDEGRQEPREKRGPDEGSISVSYCQMPEDEGTFGLASVIFGEWCLWAKQKEHSVG